MKLHHTQRPKQFRINPNHQLAKGLVFAGLGLNPGTERYYDSSVGQKASHGTLTNMDPASDWAREIGRAALDFDGSNDRVPITPINLGTVYSYAGWSFLTYGSSIHFGGDYTPQTYMLFSVNTAPSYVYHQARGSYTDFGAGMYSIGNIWTHYAIVRNNLAVTLYKNGKFIITSNLSAGNEIAVVNTIGAFSTGSYPFKGRLADQLLFRDRLLNQAEISALADRNNFMLSLNGSDLLLEEAPPVGSKTFFVWQGWETVPVGMSASSYFDINWLSTTKKEEVFDVDFGGTSTSYLSANQIVNIDFAQTLQNTSVENINWLNKLSQNKIFNVEFLENIGTISRIFNVDNIKVISQDKIFNLDNTQRLAGEKISNVDWIIKLTGTKTIDIDWLSKLLLNNIKDMDWTQTVSEQDIFNVDYGGGVTSSLLADEIFNVDWLNGILEQKKNNIEWAAQLSSDKIVNLEWLNKLSQDNIVNVDFAAKLSLISRILNVDYSQILSLRKILNIDYLGVQTYQVLANEILNIDWTQKLLGRNTNVIDNLNQLSSDKTTNIEWQNKLAAISRILNIDYNSFLRQDYLGNVDFLQKAILDRVVNLDYISKVTGLKPFAVDWQGQIIYLLVPQILNIDHTSSLQQSVILDINYWQVLSILKKFNIDYGGAVVTYPVSTDKIFNVDWWLRSGTASGGIWILGSRGTIWILDTRSTDWILSQR